MRILHIGYGFRPWREGGLIAYAEDVLGAQDDSKIARQRAAEAIGADVRVGADRELGGGVGGQPGDAVSGSAGLA